MCMYVLSKNLIAIWHLWFNKSAITKYKVTQLNLKIFYPDILRESGLVQKALTKVHITMNKQTCSTIT